MTIRPLHNGAAPIATTASLVHSEVSKFRSRQPATPRSAVCHVPSPSRARLIGVFTALLALAVTVPACAQTPAAKPQIPTLQKVRQSGVIVLAHRESSIPFSYLDASKQPVGYAVDLCLRVVEAIRREYRLPSLGVQYLPVTAAERIPKLLSGEADLECGNTTNTAARRKQVAFSVTHYFAGGRLLVPSNAGVRRLSDLRGKSIVVNKGSTHASYLTQLTERQLFSAQIIEAKDAAEAFAMLEKGTANAYLHDDIVLYSLRANSAKPDAWALVGEFTTVEPLAIMLRRDDPEFKKLVDITLSRLMIDNQIIDLWRRWFESPIPPNKVVLGVPMNALMRDQIRFPSDKVGDEPGG